MDTQVYTNSVRIVRSPTIPYFHYDVEIIPDLIVKRRNYEVVDVLQHDHAALFNPRPLYDGRKNMYCPRDVLSGNYTISLGRKQVQVLIKRVSIVNPSDVQKLTQKRALGDTSDNTVPLMLLQLLIRQAPNMRHRFPADARSFYIDRNSRDLGNGISAWRGYFQSVRPVVGGLVINVDVSHAAMYTPGYLIDTMLAHLNIRDIRGLENLQTLELSRLRVFLKGVNIRVPFTKMRPRPISDVVPHAGLQEFDKEGERWTVQKHFEGKYGNPVRFPRAVGVRVGRTAIIPAEFCVIEPGQLYRKKMPPDCQNEFTSFSTQRPSQRLQDINRALSGPGQLFDYGNSDYILEAGMVINTQPMSIPAKIIPPPRIMYGNETIGEHKGAWNLLNKRFYRPAKLHHWVVAIFDNSREDVVIRFIGKLRDCMKAAGMTVPLRSPPMKTGSHLNPEDALNQCYQILRTMDPSVPFNPLIVVILPSEAAECRRKVKHWGDIQTNVATQCVRKGKWEKMQDQYCNNVALKINARLGGINSIVRSDASAFLENCMVVGADVGHPGPGAATRPSVTGLVASVDPYVSIMTSFASVQPPRQEMIEDLQDMMMKSIVDYKGYRKTLMKDPKQNPPPPQCVIFYRDGVSEGEFAQVASREIPMIKAAFAQTFPKHLIPKLLFIVVGKRHHVRFFPQSDKGGKQDNCPAGLLVDQQIVNPQYPDFYLQSHAGLLGTSRPAHYIILENETSLTIPQVQATTFFLCHNYASATRSVSIPAPVYYADQVCGRMEFHCADGAGLSDTASNVTGAQQEFDLDYWKAMFKPSGLSRRMNFL